MTTRRKEQFNGNTIKSFGWKDQRFQWSRAYKYYSSLPLPTRSSNQIWTLGNAMTGYVPKVYDFKELILRCIKKFNMNQRIIQLQGQSHVSLAPLVFKRMLKILDATKIFKGDEDKDFLRERNGGLDLLREYLQVPTMILEEISSI